MLLHAGVAWPATVEVCQSQVKQFEDEKAEAEAALVQQLRRIQPTKE